MSHILLVDDNEADRRAIKEAFGSACPAAMLHFTEDGDKALRFVFNKTGYEDSPVPDLILLDLNLPGSHGLEVLREIKNHPEKKRIPVLVLSSSVTHSDIAKAYDAGANCYVNKPMRFTELVKLMTLVCDFWIKEVRFSTPK